MGYLHVYTGNGKGKTTAAFGLALRALGRGRRVFVGQFVKHEPTGEAIGLLRIEGADHAMFGSPRCVGEDMKESDRNAAAAGLAAARKIVASGAYDLVVLDELNVAVATNLLKIEDVLELAASRGPDCELVITGRYADQRLIESADLVTEMVDRKHYVRSGVYAREGIEF